MTDTATGAEIDALLAHAVDASAAVDPDNIVVTPPPQPTTRTADAGTPATRDELRRLTIVFSDLVGSTPLSGTLDPETYRSLLALYKEVCRAAIEEFDGNLIHSRGDGILAVFGHPVAHEDDAARAVRAGLTLHRELERRLAETPGLPDVPLQARVGIHRGLVYLEREADEIYGLAVNVAARVQEATDPGTVAVTDEVRDLLGDLIWTEPLEPRAMKGVEQPPGLHLVLETQPSDRRSVRRWASPMIGRDDVRDRILDTHRTRADDQLPRAVLVLGEAGIGKSRLVGAVVDEIDHSVPVLELVGSPRSRLGLHPIRVLIQDLAQIRDDRPPAEQLGRLREHLAERDLDSLLPSLAPVLGIGPDAGYEPVSLDPARLEAHIADAVFHFLVSHLEDECLLIVEDLHWIDDQTVGVVDRLIREGPAGSLILMTSRDESACGGDRTVVERLAPLADDDAERLIDVLDDSADAAARAAVRTRCDGVPLYIEEMVRSGAPTATLTVDTDPDGAVPPALYDTLYARLNALADERPVLSAAAAIGRMVSLDVLASVTELSTDALDRAVTGLMDQQVLEHMRGDTSRVRFRHELVREVAYEIEPPSGRRRLHGRIAHVLRDRSGGNAEWERIAHHHQLGGDPAAAIDALQHAADDARRRGSLAEARDHLGRAVALVDDAPAGDARDTQETRLRLRRAFLAVSSEGFGSEDAAADYRRCLELSVTDAAGDPFYETLIALWGYYVNRSDLDRAQAISTALGHLSVGPRAPMLPTNVAGHGMIAWYQGRFHDAAERLGAAVAHIDDIGLDDQSTPESWTMPLDPVSSMHIHHSLARFWVGDLTGARDEFERARARCASLPFPLGPFSETYVLLMGTWMDLERDDTATALQRAAEAGQIAETHGFEAWLLWASIAQSAIVALAGPGPETAGRCADTESLLELWHALGVRVLSGSMHTTLARALLAAGERDLALAEAQRAIAWAGETGAAAFRSHCHHIAAVAGPESDREAELLAALDDAAGQGAAVARLRIATDLVKLAGDHHLPLLAEAAAPFEHESGLPLVDDARTVLGW